MARHGAGTPGSVARTTPLDLGWRFHHGDAWGADAPAFDDSEWREVEIPHDWSVGCQFSPDWASATGFLPGGIGWYRLRLTLPEECRGRSIRVLFGGVSNNSEVWWNGRSLGRRPYGYSAFVYNLTEGARYGDEPNVLAVRVDRSRFNDSRWYPGSGITREVTLLATDPLHVADWGVFVTTPEVSPERAVVRVATTVRNEAAAARVAAVVTRLVDAHGAEVGAAEGAIALPEGAEAVVTHEIAVETPGLWDPESPCLYRAVTELRADDAVVDTVTTRFGIRAFRFDRDRGFFLNDRPMKLKGVCLHHDAGALGAAVPRDVWLRRLTTLQDVGCNAIRMSHNPPDEALLDLCDELGFIVMDEAFDEWSRGKRKWVDGWNRTQATTDGYHEVFEEWAERDLTAMILRDRNHPSIVLWSIGNEIDYPNDPYPPYSEELAPIAMWLTRVVHELDPTRPVTAAMAAPVTCLFADVVDIAGYNYMEHLYPEHHAHLARRTILGSENKHSLSDWLAVAENDYIASQFLWTGIDYLGEAGPWPNRGAQCGLLDLAGFRKPTSYWRESLWADWRMVRLCRDHGGWVCYTNCESIEIRQEGRPSARHTVGPERLVRLEGFRPTGAVEVTGLVGGKPACRQTVPPPAGATARILVHPDTGLLYADGRSVAHLEVRLADVEGIPVEEDDRRVEVRVEGPGRLLGIESGDQDSSEDYGDNRRQTHHGRLLAYIQSRKEAGEIEVTLLAEGLPAETVWLTSIPPTER